MTQAEIKKDLQARVDAVPHNQPPHVYIAQCLAVMVDVIAERLADK